MSMTLEVHRVTEVIEASIAPPQVIQMPDSMGGNFYFDPMIQIAKKCNELGLQRKRVVNLELSGFPGATLIGVKFTIEKVKGKR